jgi:hypothetical protein
MATLITFSGFPLLFNRLYIFLQAGLLCFADQLHIYNSFRSCGQPNLLILPRPFTDEPDSQIRGGKYPHSWPAFAGYQSV